MLCTAVQCSAVQCSACRPQESEGGGGRHEAVEEDHGAGRAVHRGAHGGLATGASLLLWQDYYCGITIVLL
jgi:hypothetical protein